jgi:hypothetical protein
MLSLSAGIREALQMQAESFFLVSRGKNTGTMQTASENI